MRRARRLCERQRAPPARGTSLLYGRGLVQGVRTEGLFITRGRVGLAVCRLELGLAPRVEDLSETCVYPSRDSFPAWEIFPT